jgi:hypothetical protein
MANQRARASDVARHRSQTDVWIDHAQVLDEDLAWLMPVTTLTLWNVKLPEGFLQKLPHLTRLDIRGGTGKDLRIVDGLDRLEFLSINQVRGTDDLGCLTSLRGLRLLMLYGLPKVTEIPTLSELRLLKRVEIGSMKGLRTMAGILAAPQLSELLVTRAMGPGSVDAAVIRAHPELRAFRWNAADVPDKVWEPVVAAIGLPEARAMHPAEWLDSQQQR